MGSARTLLRIPEVWGGIPRVTRWRIISSLKFLSREDRKQGFSRTCRRSLLDQIFQNYTWINHAAEAYGAKLFLLGTDLSTVYYNADKVSSRYLLLFAYDLGGDLKYDREMFLASLRPHKVVGWDIHFVSGLILNVHSIFVNDESTAADPEKLFQGHGRRLRTLCLSCREAESGLVQIQKRQMSGPFNDRARFREYKEERIRHPSDPKFWCRMDLGRFGKDTYGETLWCAVRSAKSTE